MSRTRGASDNVVQLDKQGDPISPAAMYLPRPLKMSGGVTLKGPGAEPVPEPPAIAGFRCDMRTVARNMEAFDLFILLDAAFQHCPGLLVNGFIIELTLEQFQALPGDARRHFRPMALNPRTGAGDRMNLQP
jgi:hypothetical protein